MYQQRLTWIFLFAHPQYHDSTDIDPLLTHCALPLALGDEQDSRIPRARHLLPAQPGVQRGHVGALHGGADARGQHDARLDRQRLGQLYGHGRAGLDDLQRETQWHVVGRGEFAGGGERGDWEARGREEAGRSLRAG